MISRLIVGVARAILIAALHRFATRSTDAYSFSEASRMARGNLAAPLSGNHNTRQPDAAASKLKKPPCSIDKEIHEILDFM